MILRFEGLWWWRKEFLLAYFFFAWNLFKNFFDFLSHSSFSQQSSFFNSSVIRVLYEYMKCVFIQPVKTIPNHSISHSTHTSYFLRTLLTSPHPPTFFLLYLVLRVTVSSEVFMSQMSRRWNEKKKDTNFFRSDHILKLSAALAMLYINSDS